MTLEICAQSLQSALNAQKGGATRIELCSALELGGLTPSSSTILLTKRYASIPIYVLIRPRAGDFVYSRIELESIKLEIENCKTMGIDGVVIGLMDERNPNKIDYHNLERLVELAQPMDVTFHRAFDLLDDPIEAINGIIGSGCKRILSSGGKRTAIEGIQVLEQCVLKAQDHLRIIAASGVSPANIEALHEVGIEEFHLSASSTLESLQSPSDLFEMNITETDIDQVREAKKLIQKLRWD